MTFQQQLTRFRRRHRAGRLTSILLGLLALAGFVGLAMIGLDLALAQEPAGRLWLVKVGLSVMILVALWGLVSAFRLSRRRGADLADAALASPRRPIAAALALDPAAAGTPLASLLSKRSLDEAAAALDALPLKHSLPWPWLKRGAIALILAAAAVLAFRGLAPQPFDTACHRLLHPASDLPPWSRFQFAVTPPSPAVIYGDDLLMTCTLTGATPDQPVECLLRQPGSTEVRRLQVSRESTNRFSHQFDGVTNPIEVAFACGKARSPWVSVDVLLQPNVLAGTLEITPPAYMGLNATRGPLDTNEISAPEGSSIVLELTSNRPLGSALLNVTPARSGTAEPVPTEVRGEVNGHSARFTFTATSSGKLSAIIRDVRGTACAKPSELGLKALPDLAPVIDLVSPPPMLLATPRSNIPIDARATDDTGLSRIQLVRTLSGFRDRSQLLASGLTKTREFPVKGGLDLAALGLQVGQTIELFVEGSDHNPSLLGQGTSGIARIQIIAEEDYAARIREKTTLREFSARFQAIERARQKARESLDQLDKAIDSKDADAVAKARENALKAHREAAELLDQLAKDFPAFELEKRLKSLAEEAAAPTHENVADLEKLDSKASADAQKQAVQQMRDRLGKAQPKFDELKKDASSVAEAGKLLEMAAKFQQIYQTQQSLVKRMQTIAREIALGNDQNKRQLPLLADTQQKNREALDAFVQELETRANEINDPALQQMKDSALEFAGQLRLSDPGSVMDAAAKHARDGASNDAFTNAELARSLLETLMQPPNPFPSACKGQCMKFSIPRPDVNQTMQQLLEGLMCQNPGMTPNQNLGGGGMGMGGTGPTGSAAPGFPMSELPVIGPDRMQFQPESLGGSGKGDSKDPRAATQLPTTTETGRIKQTEDRSGISGAPDAESVPEIYRTAVKRYFSGE